MKLEVGGKKQTAMEEENWGSHDPHTGRSAKGERQATICTFPWGISKGYAICYCQHLLNGEHMSENGGTKFKCNCPTRHP